MDTCSRLEEPGEVLDGRTSTSVVYGRLQAASGRSGRFEWPLDRIGGQGTRPARFSFAALGGTTWGWARAERCDAPPHNASDAAVGGPRGGDRPFAARERAAAHGARHFKKVDRDLCWSSEMRFRFIEDRRADYPVKTMCDVLEVSPAGYYAWRARPESRRAVANRDLVDDIKRVHRDTSGRYGSPRIHAELRAQGRGVSRGRIERLMRRHGIRAIMARPRRVRTTDSRHDLPIAPNLLERNFIARGAEPDLASRHHLRRDRSGLALSGHGHGPLQPQDRRLGDGGSFARRTAIGGLSDGRCDTAAWSRPDPPFRPWRSIRLGGVSQDDAGRRLPGLDEPQGRLL